MSRKKMPRKRTGLMEKLWYVFLPFLIYTLVKSFAMITLSMLVSTTPSEAGQLWIQQNEYMISAVINALASIVAVAFIMRDFLIEVAVTGEVDIDQGPFQQFLAWMKHGMSHVKEKALQLVMVGVAGIVAAGVLNVLISLLPINSVKYDDVEQIQYSVPIWLGLILYGLVSPIVEEIVFRGMTYNRMKRYFKTTACVIVTSLLFGGFHANLPQFLYGTIMGVLMTVCYEKVKSFAAPVLFHMTANIFVFLGSTLF